MHVLFFFLVFLCIREPWEYKHYSFSKPFIHSFALDWCSLSCSCSIHVLLWVTIPFQFHFSMVQPSTTFYCICLSKYQVFQTLRLVGKWHPVLREKKQFITVILNLCQFWAWAMAQFLQVMVWTLMPWYEVSSYFWPFRFFFLNQNQS